MVANPSATLEGASAGYRDFAAAVTVDDIMARAERTVDICVAHGTVAIRSHTNIESQTELRGVEAMVRLRERCRDRITLQVVAHLTSDAPRRLDASRQWLDGAIAAGADAIGGVPQYSDQPLAFLDLLFEFAERSGLPLDMHIDEHLDQSRHLFDAVIERTRAHGMQGRVTAGHCCALSAVAPDESARIIEGLAGAGIAVITLPAANLFLQGRDAPSLPPRGLDARASIDGGRSAGGGGFRQHSGPLHSDRIRRPAGGRALDAARRAISGSPIIATAFDMVASVPASIIGLGSSWGIHQGARADLLITDADDPEDLVATGSIKRAVLVGGRLVAGAL